MTCCVAFAFDVQCTFLHPVFITLSFQTDMDALSSSLNGLCLECGGSRSKKKCAKVKKTIEKSAGMLPIGSGTPYDTQPRAVKQPACPNDVEAVFCASSASKPKAASSVRRASHRLCRVVVCSWGARCARPTCTFFHASPAANYVLPDRALVPKPCRFGALCQKASCAFCHPSPVVQS
jgi:hypothetical protein